MSAPPPALPPGVVLALAEALAVAHADAGMEGMGPPYEDLARFIQRQGSRLGAHLRAPLAALTRAFDWGTIAAAGRRFQNADPAGRQARIESWRHARMAMKRDFVRLYESLAVFALHSRPIADPGPGSRIEEPAPAERESVDIAVIGSGPGGSLTACLLAESGREVLLIEEGPFLATDSCAPFSLEEMEQKYRNGGLTVAMGPNKVSYVEGRCVGGGSEINSGLYHRTPPEMLDGWSREFEVKALSEPDLRPHFEACERELSVSTLRGTAPAASLRLRDGANRLGWSAIEVPRWYREGASPGGARQSMTQTFIPRFLAAGGRLLAETRVSSLRRDGENWRLAIAPARSGRTEVSARTVFVCGGAVQTAALLRRSGIHRNVGNELRLHPTAKLVARFAEPVNSSDMGVPVHQVKEFSPRISLGCSISSRPHLALGLLDHPAAARAVAREWPNLAIYYAMITGEGSGSVRNLPGFQDPLVRYRLTASDRRDLGDGLKKLAEALFASGAEEIYPVLRRSAVLRRAHGPRELGPEVPSGAGLMTVHLFSSCPMGENRARCAADSYGRVHGIPNLRIADASLLCSAPGVNPQGTIMAIARRNALQFLGKL